MKHMNEIQMNRQQQFLECTFFPWQRNDPKAEILRTTVLVFDALGVCISNQLTVTLQHTKTASRLPHKP